MYFSKLFLFIFAVTTSVVGWGLFGLINEQRLRLIALRAALAGVLVYSKCSCESELSPCGFCEARYRARGVLENEHREAKKLEGT